MEEYLEVWLQLIGLIQVSVVKEIGLDDGSADPGLIPESYPVDPCENSC